MGAPALGRVYHQGAPQPQLLAQQVVMHSTHREQCRDRSSGGSELSGCTGGVYPVGEHQHIGTPAHGLLRRLAKRIEGGFQTTGAGFHGHLGGEGLHRKTLLTDRRQLGLIKHRRVEMDHRRGLRLGLQRWTTLTQMHLQAHHKFFPQGIDRRVGDLGEALLEVVVQEVGLVRKHCQGDVIPHAVGGLLCESRHVLDDQIKVFRCESHRSLQPQQIELTHLTLGGPGLEFHAAAVLLEPVGIGEPPGGVLLHRPVIEQLTFLQIDRQHLAGAEAAFAAHGLAAEIHHASLGSHDHEPVVRGAPAGRTQSVAVQGGSHPLAIGEYQKRRAVPGLLNTCIKLVHLSHFRATVEIRLIAEGFRHEGDQPVSDRTATSHHQLQRGVEVGRVTEGRIRDGIEVRCRLTPHIGEARFRGLRPVDVAQQRVDLSVVTQHPHGLSKGPARQGVGAEAAVINRETHLKTRIAQIGVVLRKHFGAHHALVHNGATAQRRHVEVERAIKPPGFAGPGTDPTPQP